MISASSSGSPVVLRASARHLETARSVQLPRARVRIAHLEEHRLRRRTPPPPAGCGRAAARRSRAAARPAPPRGSRFPPRRPTIPRDGVTRAFAVRRRPRPRSFARGWSSRLAKPLRATTDRRTTRIDRVDRDEVVLRRRPHRTPPCARRVTTPSVRRAAARVPPPISPAPRRAGRRPAPTRRAATRPAREMSSSRRATPRACGAASTISRGPIGRARPSSLALARHVGLAARRPSRFDLAHASVRRRRRTAPRSARRASRRAARASGPARAARCARRRSARATTPRTAADARAVPHRDPLGDRAGDAERREAPRSRAADDARPRRARRAPRLASVGDHRGHQPLLSLAAHRGRALGDERAVAQHAPRADVRGGVERERDHAWPPAYSRRSAGSGRPDTCASVIGVRGGRQRGRPRARATRRARARRADERCRPSRCSSAPAGRSSRYRSRW